MLIRYIIRVMIYAQSSGWKIQLYRPGSKSNSDYLKTLLNNKDFMEIQINGL